MSLILYKTIEYRLKIVRFCSQYAVFVPNLEQIVPNIHEVDEYN